MSAPASMAAAVGSKYVAFLRICRRKGRRPLSHDVRPSGTRIHGTVTWPVNATRAGLRVKRRTARRPILALALTLQMGCLFSRQNEPDNPLVVRSGETSITLEIKNDNFNDARIYVLSYGQRSRIGTVTGATFETFELDWKDDELRVEVDFIGGGGYTTDLILVSSGDVVYLRIPSR